MSLSKKILRIICNGKISFRYTCNSLVFSRKWKSTKKIRTIIESKSCFYSIISFWEIAIKQKLGKLDSSFSIQELESMCTKANIQIAPITSKSIETTKFLPLIHRDPFDRLLIAQAKNLNLILITKDMFIPQYDVKTLW